MKCTKMTKKQHNKRKDLNLKHTATERMELFYLYLTLEDFMFRNRSLLTGSVQLFSLTWMSDILYLDMAIGILGFTFNGAHLNGR